MNVLVLHQHYWPETAATAQILTDLCEDLVAAGHRVRVVCAQPAYRVRDRRTTLRHRETNRGVLIDRVPSYRPRGRTIPERVAQYSSYFATSLAAAVSADRPDVMLVMSTPPLLLGLTGLVARTVRGLPFVYSVQDLYPDVALDIGVLRPGAFARSVDRVARGLYASAAELVTLSESMAARLEAKGVSRSRIHVIHNWADTDAIAPRPRDNPFAKAHGLDDAFVIQYSGNVGRTQGLHHLPQAAALLADTPVVFAVIGEGDGLEYLRGQTERLNLRNVKFLPPQPREGLADVLASCDLGLVTMKRGVSDDLVPSKLYGVLAAGRPVLASVESRSEVARVVEHHACGVVVLPESPHELAAAIRALVAGPSTTLADMGRRAREASVAEFDRRRATSAYARVLEQAARRRVR